MNPIIPTIIPDSLENLEARLGSIRGSAERVQIDVCDGTYAPRKTWPYDGVRDDQFSAIVREERGLPYWQEFDFEIDLLLREPEKRAEDWVLAGAAALIAHVGTSEHLEDLFAFAAERRVELALALTPSQDHTLLAPWIERVAFVQVMGSDTLGFSGTALDMRALTTIRAIRAAWPSLPIGVDIGVSLDTLPLLLAAGATRFATNSGVFASAEPKAAIEELLDVVSGHTRHGTPL